MAKQNKIKSVGLVPLADRVLVEPLIETKTKTASGIYIPETIHKERPETGRVVAVGPGRVDGGKLVPVKVKVGETVLFSKYGFEEVTFGGKEYYILKEEAILAIIKD